MMLWLAVSMTNTWLWRWDIDARPGRIDRNVGKLTAGVHSADNRVRGGVDDSDAAVIPEVALVCDVHP